MAFAPAPLESQPPRAGTVDHVTLAVGDHASARRFYERALRPLGLAVLLDWPDGRTVHLGPEDAPSSVWLVERRGFADHRLALVAPDRSAVDVFHGAALVAGGRSLDAPRIRAEHTSRTYAASVADADGNVLEAFCWHAA
jgi:catechol 2,3-dioxygenase-like lactoylglutathione lyase family enzyme